jgi:hypothetical protein
MRYLNLFSPLSRKFLTGVGCDTKATSMALAKAISDKLTMPGGQVEGLEFYYKENIKDKNYTELHYIVESCLVDIDLVEQYIHKFWTIRYNLLFPSKVCRTTNNGILDFFDLATSLPKDDLDFINKNTLRLITLYNGFTVLLDEISKIEIDKRKLG